MAKRAKSPFRGGHKHIHREDAFTHTVEKIVAYFQKSPFQAIITSLTIVGIIVFGAILLNRISSDTPNDKAPPPEASLGLMNAIQFMVQNPQVTEDSLRNIAMRYPRTIPGQKAHFYLGRVLYEQERYADALNAFETFEKKYKNKQSFLKGAAFYMQANCLEEQGLFEQAAKKYLELEKKYPKSGFISFAKLQAARNYISAGNLDKAEKLLETMLKDYPRRTNSEIYSYAKAELGKIDAIRNRF